MDLGNSSIFISSFLISLLTYGTFWYTTADYVVCDIELNNFPSTGLYLVTQENRDYFICYYDGEKIHYTWIILNESSYHKNMIGNPPHCYYQ